jgi:hypothetical protein
LDGVFAGREEQLVEVAFRFSGVQQTVGLILFKEGVVTILRLCFMWQGDFSYEFEFAVLCVVDSEEAIVLFGQEEEGMYIIQPVSVRCEAVAVFHFRQALRGDNLVVEVLCDLSGVEQEIDHVILLVTAADEWNRAVGKSADIPGPFVLTQL